MRRFLEGGGGDAIRVHGRTDEGGDDARTFNVLQGLVFAIDTKDRYTKRHSEDVARYAEPLVKSVHAWQTTWRHAQLVSVDLEDRLVFFDTRPRAAAPVRVLTGDDRSSYLACDGITDTSQLDPAQAERLPSLAARGLMLNDCSRYLSLGIPIGEYQPSRGALTRLRPLFARVDARDRPRVRRAFTNH